MTAIEESDSRSDQPPPRSARQFGSPELRLKNLQRGVKVEGRSFRLFLRRLAAELAPDGTSATLVLVGDERMRHLNNTYRGFDRATDVLSFPARNGSFPREGDDSNYLGDIVISVETARRQARWRGSRLPRELRVLALHGLLHLLGHDHENDNGEMRRIEYRLRRKFRITHGQGARPSK